MLQSLVSHIFKSQNPSLHAAALHHLHVLCCVYFMTVVLSSVTGLYSFDLLYSLNVHCRTHFNEMLLYGTLESYPKQANSSRQFIPPY